MKPRKRIKPVSDKRAVEKRAYNARVKVWLVGKQCVVFPELPAQECHHKFGKRGRLLLFEPGWVPTSSAGHARITSNPTWAREQGFIGPVGTWNDYERAVKAQSAEAKSN